MPKRPHCLNSGDFLLRLSEPSMASSLLFRGGAVVPTQQQQPKPTNMRPEIYGEADEDIVQILL